MAIAFVTGQVANNANTSGSTVAVAFPSNVTSGGLIEVVARISADTTCSITDTLLNTYTAGPAILQATDSHKVFKFWTISASGGANTVTATFGNTLRKGIIIREFSGADAAPADDSATNTGADASVECGSVTMTADGLIVTGWGYSGTQTTTIDTDYTGLSENTTGRIGSAYRLTTAITDEAVHTASATNNWSAVTETYKESGGAPATAIRILFPAQTSAMGVGGVLGGNRTN